MSVTDVDLVVVGHCCQVHSAWQHSVMCSHPILECLVPSQQSSYFLCATCKNTGSSFDFVAEA